MVGNYLIYKFDRQPAKTILHRKKVFGAMAEWSCRGLQILVRRFDSGSRLQNRASKKWVSDPKTSLRCVQSCGFDQASSVGDDLLETAQTVSKPDGPHNSPRSHTAVPGSRTLMTICQGRGSEQMFASRAAAFAGTIVPYEKMSATCFASSGAILTSHIKVGRHRNMQRLISPKGGVLLPHRRGNRR